MLLHFQYQQLVARWSYKMLRLNLHEHKSWSASTLPSLILEGGFNNKFSFYNSLYLASTVIFRRSTFLEILWIGRICKILYLQIFLTRSMVSWLNLQRLTPVVSFLPARLVDMLLRATIAPVQKITMQIERFLKYQKDIFRLG